MDEILWEISREIQDLLSAIQIYGTIGNVGLDYYKRQKSTLYEKKIEISLSKLLALRNKLCDEDYRKIAKVDECLNSLVFVKDKPDKLKQTLSDINQLLPQELPSIDVRFIPETIRKEVLLDLEETRKCYSSNCFRSATILCGRILETALHRKYYELTGKDILETAPAIGLGKLIAKLKELDCLFDPGLTEQIHLINQVRVGSVHKKQAPFMPSRHQTKAMMLYTEDVLKKLFTANL